jgi:hypothetical protein
MASNKPIKMPAKKSGESSASRGRPSSRLIAATNASIEASGFVSTAVLDGGELDLWLDDGERGGPDFLCKYFSGVFPANARDICVVFYFMGSFV